MNVLDILEAVDSRVLAWGNTNYSFTRDDYVSELMGICTDPDEEFELAIRKGYVVNLEHRNMPNRFRTRMGEAVILFTELRQLLPSRSIQSSPGLVSDFRFVRSPREVPRRDIDINDFFSSLSEKNIPASTLQYARNFLDVSGRFTHLSGFQSRAFEEIAGLNKTEGVVVTAGTGSGKSLAFYLPIFSTLASNVALDSSTGTRVLSIYPRNELLKDQLRELISALRPFNEFLAGEGVRPITVGAYFGDTPQNTSSNDYQQKVNDTYKCPAERCNGSLSHSSERSSEVLSCVKCGFSIRDSVAMTREQMRSAPPDILLTSAEMLSQRLTDREYRRLFGVHANSKLKFVLMDEIHTYGGVTGAQTALLIRRWRKLLPYSVRPKFVGLSATLDAPEAFFSSLIGSVDKSVLLVTPNPTELERLGSEYLLCLRGDPASKTALLSTTIQAMMLGNRILDSIRSRSANSVWPGKLFAFTDSLDILNRLFFDYLDAEGYKWNSWKRKQEVNTNKLNSLASLRDPQLTGDSTSSQGSYQGQNWEVLKQFGHRLDRSDIIGDQTSSFSSGVNPQANVVVATSSLEVGFNDPEVGMVFQHKAPRDIASYLQRKGRAGRSVSSRPWMVVVLSEFGRDRELFLRYDELARPIIDSKSLPTENTHVQKMAAAGAFLDWVGEKTQVPWVYGALKSPQSRKYTSALRTIREFLSQVLQDKELRDDFSNYLTGALKITHPDDLNTILWSVPRGVFSEFLPSIERELVSNFAAERGRRSTADHRNSPAPEFMTGQLFGALNVPDISIVPPSDITVDGEIQQMEFFQALKEFAPGRISKRYAKWGKDAWVVLPSDFEIDASTARSQRNFLISESNQDLSAEMLIDNHIEVDGCNLRVLRPLDLKPKSSKTISRLSITDRSHSVHLWEIKLQEPLKPVSREYLIGRRDGSVSMAFSSSLHSHGDQRQITRFSRSASANFTTRNRESVSVDFSFVDERGPVALGCTNYHDLIEFEFKLPVDFSLSSLDKETKRRLRLTLFQDLFDRLVSDSELVINQFDIGWIRDCFLGYALSASLEHPSMDGFRKSLVGRSVPDDLLQVPLGMFARDELLDEDDSANANLYQHLEELLSNQTIFEMLVTAFNGAFDDDDPRTEAAFRDLVARSLAGLINAFTLRMLPDLAENLLLTEILPSRTERAINILISESDPGGCGYLERLRSLLVRYPGRAIDGLISCTKPTDSESVLVSIQALLASSADEDGGGLLDQFREASTASDSQEISRLIKRRFLSLGKYPSKTLMNVLYTKILRTGSSVETDARTRELIDQWESINSGQGLEWPLTVYSFVVAAREASSNEELQRIKSEVQDLLYPQGHEVRANALNFYNKFSGLIQTDRAVVEGLLQPATRVPVIDGFEKTEILAALKAVGEVEVVISPTEQSKLESLVSDLLVCDIEHHGLLFAPTVTSISYVESGLVMKFELPKVSQ